MSQPPSPTPQPQGVAKEHWLYQVQKRLLLPPKLIYVTMSMTFYAFYLFRASFITEYLGFNERHMGDITAIMALITFVAMTLWGTFADATGRHRLVLAASAVGMAGAFMLFLVRWTSSTANFGSAIAVASLYSFFQSGMQPLTDYQALKLLGQRSEFNKDLYGRQRLWGTIAYGATSYFVSLLIKKDGLTVLFYCVPITAGIFVVVLFAFAMPDAPKSLAAVFRREQAPTREGGEKAAEKPGEGCVEKAAETASRKGRFKQLLKNPHYLFLLLVVFLTGSARAVMTNFLAHYLGKDMGLRREQLGIMANFGILFEVVIFFFGPWFIRTIGIYWMLILSQLAMVVRCWAYVFLPADPSKVYYVYAIELLKGVAFGFTQSAGVKLANDVSPKGLEATAQALYTSMYSQLPAVLTAFVGGRVYHKFGPYTLFLAVAIISSVALVLFLTKYAADGSIRLFFCFRQRQTLQTISVSAP